MSKRFELYHAINNNMIPDNLGVNYNITSLKQFLIDNQNNFSFKFNTYEYILMNLVR
jgi:hypothetical protein